MRTCSRHNRHWANPGYAPKCEDCRNWASAARARIYMRYIKLGKSLQLTPVSLGSDEKGRLVHGYAEIPTYRLAIGETPNL